MKLTLLFILSIAFPILCFPQSIKTDGTTANEEPTSVESFETKDQFRTSFFSELTAQRKELLLQRLIQGLGILALLSPCYFIKPIRDRFINLSATQKISLLTFGSITLVGQIFSFNQYSYPQRSDIFPFTRFAMFVGSTEQLTVLEHPRFKGIDANGEEIKINPFRVFRSIRSTTLFTKLKFLARNLKNEKDQARLELAHLQTTKLLKAFHEYYEKELGHSLTTIIFYVDRVDYTNRNNPVKTTETLFILEKDEL